jgi:hypothetical protein
MTDTILTVVDPITRQQVGMRLHDNGDGTFSEATYPQGGAAVQQGAVTNRSGTITAGGSAQQLAAANTGRRYLLVQNPSNAPGSLWIDFGVNAVQASPSIEIAVGVTYELEGSFVPTSSVSIIGPTTGQAFTAKEG